MLLSELQRYNPLGVPHHRFSIKVFHYIIKSKVGGDDAPDSELQCIDFRDSPVMYAKAAERMRARTTKNIATHLQEHFLAKDACRAFSSKRAFLRVEALLCWVPGPAVDPPLRLLTGP